MMEESVFSRTQVTAPILSDRVYNLVIGAVLLWGFMVNWFMVGAIDPYSLAHINKWVFYIGYFASCLFGIYLFTKSDKPLVSFIGYNFVVIPFGLIVNLVVSRYNPELVYNAVQVTGLVTSLMMVAGTLFPAFFRKIAGALTIALLAVIVVEMVQIFIFKMHSDWLDWAVALIFCGYIGYDWGRANSIPKTLDNAIDSAAALYMDIINLFLRILSIMDRKK